MSPFFEVFLAAFKLGLTSFGGPAAHIGYFQREYVTQRRWLDESTFASLVALCHALPGPASSQLGIAIGVIRGGWPGALAAWLGFTLPTAIILIALASALRAHPSLVPELHGLSIVAMGVVAQAVLLLGRKLVRNWSAGLAAAGALFLFLILNSAYTALLVITAAGFFGIALRVHAPELPSVPIRLSPRGGAICLALFLALLVFFSVLAKFSDNLYIQTFDVFYRTGSLVFGGGHVVLPLLETEIVGRGWMNREGFLSGYGAAQAMPGPLFAFAGYVGSSMLGIGGGIVAIVGIFLPGFLLVVGSLSWWNRIQKNPSLRSALAMIGASAVGILGAALVILLNSALRTQFDLILAIILLAMLLTEKIPAWVVTAAGLCAWKAWTVL